MLVRNRHPGVRGLVANPVRNRSHSGGDMSRRATVEPVWLDRMLVAWGTASIRSSGWYSINPMLKDGIPNPARSMEPMGLTSLDFRQLESAINALPHHNKLAITRAYKPWAAREIEHETSVYGVTGRVWGAWLAEAAGLLLRHMDTATHAA